jgi:hypothetical protein
MPTRLKGVRLRRKTETTETLAGPPFKPEGHNGRSQVGPGGSAGVRVFAFNQEE